MQRLYLCLTEQHDLVLVALAVVICTLGSYTTLVLLVFARQGSRRQRLTWRAVTAVATGTAIWATHFVAMLAFDAGAPVSYDSGLTVLSLAVAILTAGAAFLLLEADSRAMRLAVGLLVGAGASAMHYTGMSGFTAAGAVIWNWGAVAASVAASMPLAALALAIGLRPGSIASRLAGTLLLALAVCVLHFTGMSGVTVLAGPDAAEPDGLGAGTMAALVGLGTMAVLVISGAAAAVSLRERRREAEEGARRRTLADATVEGLMVCDRGQVVMSNRSLEELTGRDAAWFAGRPVQEILPDLVPDPEIAVQETPLIDARGNEIPVEVVCRPIALGKRPHLVLAVRDLRERRKAEERIRFLAHHDPLTGLPNRVGFSHLLTQMLAQRDRGGRRFAVLALDLDRFKLVNDSLGHAVGDALLVKVAARLKACVCESDIIARLGGDEFAVVQTELRKPDDARTLAQRLVEILGRPFVVNGQILNIGASIGIALYPEDSAEIAALMRNADLALYRAKAEGRGTYHFFEAEMDTRMQQRRSLEVELRTALALRQFHLLYQPLIKAADGAVCGFEALIRWRHAERGLISPADFIPLAEETGLILPIGEWVLREACREVASWNNNVSIAVNISPVQFRSVGLVEMVQNACAAAGLDPHRLELEITEGVLLNDSEAALQTLRELRALGVRISMDDFGTGYSSLSYLRSFPFDKLKIDRSFAADITANEQSAEIIRSIISLGRSLGMTTTVEGVETQEQLAYLRAQGCDQVQGYVVGRPLLPQQARAMLATPEVAA